MNVFFFRFLHVFFCFLRLCSCLFPTSLCGVLVFGSVSRRPSVRLPSSASNTTCSHTTCPHTTCPLTTCSHTTCPHTTYSTHNLLTHNFLTHNLNTYNLLTHNLSSHNLLTHNLSTHNLLTHNLLTHNLSTHNLSTHNLFTHNLLTHNLSTQNLLTHNLLTHNLSTHTTYSHTTCPHTTYSHTTCSHTTAWQAWHLATRSSTLRGRRGTLRHPPSFHVAGVVLGHIDFHFAWQAWHVWHRAGSGGALGSQVSPWAPRLFAWQAWPPWTTGPFLRFWRIMRQCCSWKRSCHKGPPGLAFMPSSAGAIRVSLKLLWATSACCVPPYAAWLYIAEVQLEETFWTLWPSAVVRSCPWCSMWLFARLGLDPDSVCSIYRL